MKKRACIFGALIAVLLVISAMAVSSFAVTNIAGNTVKDGVSYKLSDNGEYYTAVGPADVLPSLTVVSNIDGIPVTEIAESAFQNNEYINDITISSSVKTIGKAAFRNCKNLATVTFNGTLEKLPDECFYDCKMLTYIDLPQGLVSIGDDCFKHCKMLRKLKIPSSVTFIGHDAFLNCESILLDVSENPYAAQYAETENINTDFTNTTTFFLLLIIGSVIVGLIIFFILSKLWRKHFEKYPHKNPTVFIDKFFLGIGKFFAFIFGLIKKAVLFVCDKIISLIELISKKLNKRRLKKYEQQKEDENSDASE